VRQSSALRSRRAPDEPLGLLKKVKHVRIWGLFALIALIIALPFVVGDPTFTSTGVYILLYTAAALAWNLFSGFTGYINLGAAAYIGVGGYAMAILCQDWNIQGGYGPFFLLPLAGLITAVCAIPLGWLALRLRRYAFIVMTIAIFYIGQYLAYNLGGLTNGATGIFLPNPPWDAYFFDVPFYFIALAVLALVTFTSWWVRYSKYGLSLIAIRDDEDRALSLGIQAGRYKLIAYVLSSFFIGMVGAVLIYYTGTVYPYSAFNSNFNVFVAVITFVGGFGTVIGPIVGGLLLVPLQQYLNTQFGAGAANFGLVVFGTILLLTVLVLPGGIVPMLSTYGKKWISIFQNKQFKEASPQPSFSTPSESSLISISSIAPQEIFIPRDSIEQPSKQLVLNIPRHLTEQPLPESVAIGNMKFRTQRLVSISHEGGIKMQEHVSASTVRNWRCPYCRRPYLLNGNICYCPKCGFTRPLDG
jgi:ABC-type branched-subunit amino acid transport system permease subunit